MRSRNEHDGVLTAERTKTQWLEVEGQPDSKDEEHSRWDGAGALHGKVRKVALHEEGRIQAALI